MTAVHLVKTLAALKPPCEAFRCRRYQECAEHEMACESYVMWVNKGRLMPTPDEPNGLRYSEVFDSAD